MLLLIFLVPVLLISVYLNVCFYKLIQLQKEKLSSGNEKLLRLSWGSAWRWLVYNIEEENYTQAHEDIALKYAADSYEYFLKNVIHNEGQL